jgi:hypothetical protein
MLRLALLIAGIVAATSTAALAAPRATTSYAFGRTGGNIAPFTVSIAANGAVTVVGPVRTTRTQISPAAMTRLSAVFRAARFSGLPATTRCAGELPDIAADVVTTKSGAVSKTVLVHGECSQRFTTVLTALMHAVGLKYGTG